MEFRCQDLRDAGVVLVPPDSPQYRPLFADIRRRLDSPATSALSKELLTSFNEGDPTAAVLLNQSAKSIAAWSLIWKYEEHSGREYGSFFITGVGMIPSLLLPFEMSAPMLAFAEYWQAILPGSKRWLSGGRMFGDNSDVRPPTPEEEWTGAGFGFHGDHRRPLDKMKRVGLVLDGIFFSDGEFAGPNEGQLFERIIHESEVYQHVARLARDESRRGADASRTLALVEQTIRTPEPLHPLPPGRQSEPEEFREQARGSLALHLSHVRRTRGDRETVSMLVNWADTALPRYRRS